MRLKKFEFGLGLDTFGDDAKVEAAAHADHGGDDGSIVRLRSDLANERLIDLE